MYQMDGAEKITFMAAIYTKTIVNKRCYRVNIRDFNPILTEKPRYRDLVMYRSMNYCTFGHHT